MRSFRVLQLVLRLSPGGPSGCNTWLGVCNFRFQRFFCKKKNLPVILTFVILQKYIQWNLYLITLRSLNRKMPFTRVSTVYEKSLNWTDAEKTLKECHKGLIWQFEWCILNILTSLLRQTSNEETSGKGFSFRSRSRPVSFVFHWPW